jgi:hypothetical protein
MTRVTGGRSRVLLDATGAWIHGLDVWTTWATLTFRRAATRDAAYSTLFVWLRLLAKHVARDHVRVTWGFDYQVGGYPHFHVLLALPTQVTTMPGLHEQLAVLWRRAGRSTGFSHFRRFDKDQGAAWYSTSHEEWDTNVACPRPPRCRRTRGCRFAPSSL